MYKYKDVRAVHIELTERCNLACLMCDRNINGGEVNPYLEGRTLSFQDIHQAFLPSFIKQLKKVYFCGNYGDPILARDLLQIVKYFRRHNESLNIGVITNGCSKPSMWWRELAKVVSYVRFGIDGLCDTHKIYRQNVIWDLVVRNAKAFIDAGGYAIWDYLVFKHNEHQVVEASLLSKEWGFKEFVVKKTGRFFSTASLKGKDEHQGLEKPTCACNINDALKKEKIILEKYGSMDHYLDNVDIDCKALKNKEIYISAEGIILPCCWLAGQMYKWFLPPQAAQVWEIIDKEKMNMRSIKNVLDSGILDEIEKRWKCESIANGKLKTCALKCGKELDAFGDQFK